MPITAKIVKGSLVITLPLNDPPVPSKTGKTLIVASSHGNQTTELSVNGKAVTVGVNAYIKPPRG